MMNIAFVSLGCPKNQVDLEFLAGSLEGQVNFTADPAECDLMIINTCGFIEEAVTEAIDTILSMKAELPEHAQLVVFGCMTERYKNDIAQTLPEVDFFAGVDAQKEILDYIYGAFPSVGRNVDVSQRYLFNLPYYAYLKISEGCSNRCAYCTIPSIRGPHRSFSHESILLEADTMVERGVKELIIISQDSTKYSDGDIKLPQLLAMLAKRHPQTYIRLMYLNPDGVKGELIDVVKRHNNVVKYFEIPVQHASDRMLKRMNRHSDAAGIRKIYEIIRREIPEAFIRTTFIVGFPGETEEDFQATEAFITEMKPDFAGFFAYSPEDGTVAADFEDRISERTVTQRIKKLQKIQKRNTSERLKALKKGEILIFAEEANRDFEFIVEGRALFQAPEIDGKVYVTEGVASDGSGPYRAKITRVVYPDVYVKIVS